MRTASSSLTGLFVLLALAGCKNDYELSGERPNVDPGEVTECGFTGVTGTRISRYDCNPVFTTTGESWASEIGSVAFHTTEVLGHPFYQIWYVGWPTGGNYGSYSMGYAVSGDGTNWDAHPQNPMVASQGNETWDTDLMDGLQVVWDDAGSRYVAAYQGANIGTDPLTDPSSFGLGVLTSPDGVTWTRHPNNPVMDFSDILASGPRACWPLSLTASGGAFTSYLGASEGDYDPLFDPDCDDPFGLGLGDPCVPACELYIGTSSDLANWTVQPNPVMRTDQWYELKGIASAAVAELDGVKYLFYISFERWVTSGGDIVTADGIHFNMATSSDGGQTWIKDPMNPLDQLAMTTPVAARSVGAQTVGRRIHFWIGDDYPEAGGDGVGYFIFEPDLEMAFQ
ncbi:MAG: hypothetical protein EP330_20255 [Deltaproteobacteria bacterium]|nr:MAG: hypothetical protein EP330_20255 [Deltaproteobacteria bacterium]